MSSNNIRLGLVGAGRWGRNYIRTINELDGVTLSHLASGNPESANLVAEDCRICPDWRSFVTTEKLDGLIIASPPDSHAEIALAAIGADLPVMIEKPLTLEPAEAVLLTKTAENKDALVMVDHTHLYSPAFRALKTMATEWNRLDNIISRSGNWGPFRNDVPVLWDWGAHDISMILDIVGEFPDEISARSIGSYVVEGGQAESINIDLAWNSGLSAKIELNNHRSDRINQFEVHRGGEMLIYDDVADNKLSRSWDDGKSFETITVAATLPLTQAVVEFAEAIRQNTKDRSGLILAEKVILFLKRCDEALIEDKM